MDVTIIFSFSLASFFMALMPGPDNIFVITESVAKGSRNGILISLGLNSGVLVHTLAATTGVSLILQQSELAFQIVQYFGSAYLIFMAYGAFKEKPIALAGSTMNKEGAFKLFRTGFVMNVLNPKVSLFFIAFLPQFVQTDQAISETMQMLVFGLLFMIIGFASFSSFALLASQLRKPLSSPKFWVLIKWVKVLVLVFLGVYLLLG